MCRLETTGADSGWEAYVSARKEGQTKLSGGGTVWPGAASRSQPGREVRPRARNGNGDEERCHAASSRG